MFDDFTVEEQKQLLDEIAEFESQRARFRATASPDLARSISQISQIAPHLGPEVVLPLAQYASDGRSPEENASRLQQAEQMALDTAKLTLGDPNNLQPQDDEPSGWFGRMREAAMDNIKTGSRWAFAGLNLAPQLLVNAGSRAYAATVGKATDGDGIYTAPTTDVDEGWFASTDFGSMLSGRDAGEGFFIGEEALKYQQDKVMEYRGQVGDGGWTFGRGIAMSAFQPGTREYSILSGLVDAGFALATPAVPGVKALRQGATVLKSRAGMRTLAGLTNFEDATIVRPKVQQWLAGNDGNKVIDRLVGVNDMDEALEVFTNAPTKFLTDITNAKTRESVKSVLEQNLGLGVANIEDINLSRIDDWKRTVLNGTQRFNGFTSYARRMGAKVPGREVVINFDNEFDSAQSLRNVNNYLKTLRVDSFKSSATDEIVSRAGLLNRLAAVTSLDNVGDFRNTMDLIDDAIAEGLARTGKLKGEGEAARVLLRKFRDEQESSLFGAIDAEGKSNIFAMADEGMELEVLSARKGEVAIVPDNTAGWASEERRYAALLPDPVALRRTTSKLNWIFEQDSVFKRNPEIYGKPRIPIAALDFMQNKVWKPGTLMTGGYALRNISESMIRSTMAPGIRTGPLHPLEWILTMTRRKYSGTVRGFDFSDDTAEALARGGMREFQEAVNPSMREMVDPAHMARRALQTGAWAEASKAGTRRFYRQGVADALHKASEDEVAVFVANQILNGITDNTEIIDWMRSTPQGRIYAKRLQARWSNKRPAGAKRGERVTYDFYKEQNGQVILNENNLNKWLNGYVRPRLLYETGEYQELLQVVANRDFFGEFVRNGETFQAFKTVGGLDGVQAELSGYSDEFLKLIDELTDLPDSKLPERVTRRVNVNARGDFVNDGGASAAIRGSMDRVVNHFFGAVYGKKEASLNRSPAFRQFYYRQIGNLADELSQEQASALVTALKNSYIREQVDVLEDLRRLRRIPAGTDVTPISYKFGGPGGKVYTEAEWQKLGDELRLAAGKGDADAARRLKGYNAATTRNKNKPLYPEKYRIGDEVIDGTEYQRRLAAAQKAADDAAAKFNDKWAEKWVGSKDLWRKIKDYSEGKGVKKRPGEGLSLEEIDAYAKGYALDEVKRLFYNAAETSNFADIMRIISPFGQAWAEVMRAWQKTVLMNPNRLKNFGVTFRGIRDADPDGDGKGFIYKDPVTGEMMFNYPFVEGMAPLITGAAGALAGQTLLGRSPLGMAGSALAGGAAGTAFGGVIAQRATTGGLEATLTAPVKSLNMALNVLPSVGPVVQIAANQILGDKPQFDDLRSVLLPYGTYEPTPTGLAEQLTPSWAKKIIGAIRADPDQDRLFADMYMDSYRALFASGNYDNTDPTQLAQLREDAAVSARYLLGLRGIGQFLGPARPDVLLQVPTKYKEDEITLDDVTYLVEDGNVPNNVLSKAFRYFQEEDYENAVPRFLATFGSDTFLYLRGTTTAVSKGIDASEEFGDWERNNKSFRETHRDVFGYFADVGTQFDLETYLRQIKTGDRRRVVDPTELQADSESVVGKAMYRQAVREAGMNPTPATQGMLRKYRAYLYQALPGFSTAPLDINQQADTIRKIEDASRDPLMAGNEIARAAVVYFDARAEAIEIANQRRIAGGGQAALQNALSGNANADLRAYLRHTGEMLVNRFPEFERLFSRELFNEIDIDA